jgi:hypothetical protein
LKKRALFFATLALKSSAANGGAAWKLPEKQKKDEKRPGVRARKLENRFIGDGLLVIVIQQDVTSFPDSNLQYPIGLASPRASSLTTPITLQVLKTSEIDESRAEQIVCRRFKPMSEEFG